MKQTKLVIKVVNPSCDEPTVIDPATIDNVRSCIDLWHFPGTTIILEFKEFEVESSNN